MIPIVPLSACGWAWLIVSLIPTAVLLYDLAAQIDEGLIHVDSSTGRALEVRLIAPRLRKIKAPGSRDYSILLHVTFVADHHQWHVIVVLDADYLLSKLVQFVEGVFVADGEDE